MTELKQIAEAIRSKNLNVGEALLAELEKENTEMFAKIVANFIKLNSATAKNDLEA